MADDKQYVKLPDGSYGAFPSSMKDAEIVAAIQKNYPQTDPLKTGQGMLEQAQGQAKKEIAKPINDVHTLQDYANASPNEVTGVPETPEQATKDVGDTSAALGLAGGMYLAPAATVGSILGGTAAGYGAKKGAEALGAGPGLQEAAEFGGNILGAAGGGYLGEAATGQGANWLASKLRWPATARQSQLGRPGTMKDILPPYLQRYVLPDWAIPKGDLGTPTNPGVFAEVPVKIPQSLQSTAEEKAGIFRGPSVPIRESPYYSQNIQAQRAAEEATKPVPLTESPYYNQFKEQEGARIAKERLAQREALRAEAESRKAVPLTESPYYQQNLERAKAMQAAETGRAPSVPLRESPYYTQNLPKKNTGFVPLLESEASSLTSSERPGASAIPRVAPSEISPTNPNLSVSFLPPPPRATGAAQEPFEPLIFSSPEEAAQRDFRMKNIERQASAAGKYHAAQGAVGKRTNLQQRIARKYGSTP